MRCISYFLSVYTDGKRSYSTQAFIECGTIGISIFLVRTTVFQKAVLEKAPLWNGQQTLRNGKICLCACILSFNLPFITEGASFKTALWNTVVENITHWKNMILRTTQNSLKLNNQILMYFSKKTIINLVNENKNAASEMISSQSVSTVHLSK